MNPSLSLVPYHFSIPATVILEVFALLLQKASSWDSHTSSSPGCFPLRIHQCVEKNITKAKRLDNNRQKEIEQFGFLYDILLPAVSERSKLPAARNQQQERKRKLKGRGKKEERKKELGKVATGAIGGVEQDCVVGTTYGHHVTPGACSYSPLQQVLLTLNVGWFEKSDTSWS